MTNIKTAIGLMSGTSMDGIDVALIKSDGKEIILNQKSYYQPYPNEIKNQIKDLIYNPNSPIDKIKKIELEITNKHIEATINFLDKYKISTNEVDIIGFHGHTILHQPEKSLTWQIGDAQLLANKTKINVMANFRQQDIALGGQGAPLTPIYHYALLKNQPKPLIILNIGGVSNITYIPDNDENNLVAFDVCFGVAPMDDLVKAKINQNFDKDGSLAINGKVNYELAKQFLSHDYFKRPYPKSLDRNQFLFDQFYKTELDDALATLSYIIAKSLESYCQNIEKKPLNIVVCGGGRKNISIMNNIKQETGIKTMDIDQIGLNGDMIEAEAFAFLAIRSMLKMPISFKKTTGALWEKHAAQTSKASSSSFCGGVFYHA